MGDYNDAENCRGVPGAIVEIIGADGVVRCWWCGDDPLYVAYHDNEWGVPCHEIGADWGAQRIKGYTADEIIGQHFSRFYTERDRSAGAPARRGPGSTA